jgi:hypothetical protein
LEDGACVSLNGVYAVTHSDGGDVSYKTIKSFDDGCRGEIAGNWKFSVARDTLTGDDGTTGTITGTRAGEDITIRFNDWTYTYKACVDLNGKYWATHHGGTPWEENIQSTGKVDISSFGCGGNIGNWQFAVEGDTINDSGGNKVGSITGTGMPSTITMKFTNGYSYTKKTCVDLTGKYLITDSAGGDAASKQITQSPTQCTGSIDDWTFAVAGDTITGSDGAIGTITGTHAGIDMTIKFTSGYTYKLDACVDLNGAYAGTHKAATDGTPSVHKDIEVDQSNGKCAGTIKCAHTADWSFTVVGVTIYQEHGLKAGTITGTGKLSSGSTIEFLDGWTYKKK